MTLSMNDTEPADNKTNIDHSRTPLRVTFGVIAALALLGNGLVCAVILRSRTMLKNSYNLMILSLAFTDMFTGFILAITPAFVIGDENFPVPKNFAGEVFCHILSSHYFVFTFGKISVAIVMLLAIDRWYAITRPVKYKATFKRWKAIVYITSVSMFCCALNWQALIEKKLVMVDGVQSCVWITLIENKLTSQIITVVYVAFTFFIPLFISMITFFHLYRVMRKSRDRLARSNSTKSFNSLLRMCAITGLFLALCWIPNQFVYVLSKFSITQLDTPLHHATVVLAMFNSCVNPWIYGATNRNYRKKFTRILCFWRKVEVAPEETDITAKERGTRSSHDGRLSKTEQQPEGSRFVDYSSFVREGSQAKPENSQEESNRKISLTGIPREDEEITHIGHETVNNFLTQSKL
ncbi:hypothetical protein ACROYT_G042753 [Oculina patagonica]